MLKITAVFILILAGAVIVMGSSCSSCGPECMSACGTRRFRSCCFNYLRKKRVDTVLANQKWRQDVPYEESYGDIEAWLSGDYDMYHLDDKLNDKPNNHYNL